MNPNVDTSNVNQPFRKVACHRPWTGFELFDHLGDVRPCCWGKVSCGNINNTSPQEIWTGNGFRLYREKMALGVLNDICGSDCPILQNHYAETDGLQHDWASGELATPLYMRVVPSITCNLKCPMCYQLSDPPPVLPADLFDSLVPWLQKASEFQIIGGEPFIAKPCLEWIDKLSPDRFPRLRLAAITNGLGFTKSTCRLISQRNWNWILVSIDAATPAVFTKVRGGNFNILVEGLKRLAEIRATSVSGFEIRLGFTLQNSNVEDAVPFLDLCDRFNAVPQYTMVFGDWHDEAPRSHSERSRMLSTIEMLDKELHRRGFSAELIGGLLARLASSTRDQTDFLKSSLLPVVYSAGHGEDRLRDDTRILYEKYIVAEGPDYYVVSNFDANAPIVDQ